MTVREYIGARYVPLFVGKWDNSKTYEPLSIVSNEGNSYTSKQYVPTGINLDNESYWAETGNFNSQVEQYREEVMQLAEDYDKLSNMNKYVTLEMFDGRGDNTIECSEAFRKALDYCEENSIKYIKLLNGTYLITETIDIDTPVMVFADFRSDNNVWINVGDNPNAIETLFNVSTSHCGFANIGFKCDYGVDEAITAIDFNVSGSYDLDAQVNNVNIYQFEYGIKICGRNVKVKDSIFSHCKYGIYYYANGESVDDEYRGLIVQNNRFHGIGAKRYDSDSDYPNTSAGVISTLSNLTVYPAILIDGNYCDLGCGLFYGLANNVTIINNEMYDCYMTCVTLSGTTVATSSQKFTMIQNNVFRGRGVFNKHAIYANDCRNVFIRNNVFSNFGIHTIEMVQCPNSIIKDCTFDGNPSTGHIILSGTSTHTVYIKDLTFVSTLSNPAITNDANANVITSGTIVSGSTLYSGTNVVEKRNNFLEYSGTIGAPINVNAKTFTEPIIDICVVFGGKTFSGAISTNRTTTIMALNNAHDNYIALEITATPANRTITISGGSIALASGEYTAYTTGNVTVYIPTM